MCVEKGPKKTTELCDSSKAKATYPTHISAGPRRSWDVDARNASKYRLFCFSRVAQAIYLAMPSKSGGNYVCFHSDAGNVGTPTQWPAI